MVRGGIKIYPDSVELTLAVSGGRSIKRVYNDVVEVAISKYSLISSMLRKLAKKTPGDIKFYIDQVQHLLRRAHVELIPGNRPFQQKYNLWLLDGYVRMLLQTADLKLISQLLYIDSILYTIEEADKKEDLDFAVPQKVKVRTLKEVDPNSEIATPSNDTVGAYLHSLDHNIGLMNTLIVANKSAVSEIYRVICKVAAKHFQ